MRITLIDTRQAEEHAFEDIEIAQNGPILVTADSLVKARIAKGTGRIKVAPGAPLLYFSFVSCSNICVACAPQTQTYFNIINTLMAENFLDNMPFPVSN